VDKERLGQAAEQSGESWSVAADKKGGTLGRRAIHLQRVERV